MANIAINLSSNTVNQLNQSGQGTTLAQDLSLFFQAEYQFSSAHQDFINDTLNGSNLRIDFSDGASYNYNGVILSGTNTASATAMEEYWPTYYRTAFSGQLNYEYSVVNGFLYIGATDATLTSGTVQTLLPRYSPAYDTVLGNVTMAFQGNLYLSNAGNLSGTVTSLTGSADNLLASTALTGNFNVNGNYQMIGEGLSTLNLSGTATSYAEQYRDGSSVSMSNIAIAVDNGTVMTKTLLENAANFNGDDVINISLGARPSNAWTIASGAGNDQVSISGGGSGLAVNAGSGNDVIRLGDDGHTIDGGSGTDTAVFSGARAGYTIAKAGAGYSVTSLAGSTDQLSGVERLQFSDTTLALDVSGNAGQVYRLYQAAFNRVPDSAGLGYWIKAADNGSSLDDIARNFATSKEFTDLYGTNSSNADFLDHLYHNVLHRAGDKAGFDWWLANLNSGANTQAQALAQFGESAENQAALIGVIGNGFSYTPYG